MRCKTAALLALVTLLAACASQEGGSRGSGISTLVRGNIDGIQTAAVRAARAARSSATTAPTSLEGIRVTLEGSTVEDTTDTQGQFSLQGNFEGNVTLVFQRTADALLARMQVNVPAAGTLTLTNVRIDPAQHQAVAGAQAAEFEGIITAVDCPASTVDMRSVQQDPTELDIYTMRLDTSSVQGADGGALTCSDLRDGERARVEAAVNADGTFGNGVIQVE